MTDPFDALALPDEPIAPRAEFATALRARLVAALAHPDADIHSADTPIPDVQLPDRRPAMPTATALRTTVVTPYLAVHDAAAALAFYADAFGAIEHQRIVGDDGRVGHSEFAIGAARFFLSDEYPEFGVLSPRALGGTSVTLHLEVDAVDSAFDRAVAAGATALVPPADQPHGARHGTLSDPFGHRWMLSQQVEQLSTDELASRMAEAGYAVESTGRQGAGGIWAAVNAADAPAMIAFMTGVLGFDEQLVVPGAEPGVIEHSQLLWPEGGTVQVATANRPGNLFSQRPVGGQSLYVITSDPQAVYARCVAAGVDIVMPPSSPDYDPDGLVFSFADHEGNLWSFGTYAGG